MPMEKTMNLKQIEEKLVKVSDIYAEKFKVNRDSDWFIIKMQEELGELASVHLKLSNRGRPRDQSTTDLEKNLKEEIADLIAMTLLFAQHKGVDVQEALKEKWFKYL